MKAWLGAPLVAAIAWSVVSCSPSSDQPDGDAAPDVRPAVPDEDGDGISDEAEGRAEGVDTDGDGTPDYLDLDSDGDGIPDALESGSMGDPSIPPRDTDGDGTPDFRDLDSDGNGIFDSTEGGEDLDGDGLGNWCDVDDDGDFIVDVIEIGDDPSRPLDTDGDGTPDFRDTDSDNDTISDLHEQVQDTDGDGIPDRHDLDSDGDGIPDSVEAGDADLATPPVDTDGDLTPDFRDLDSDADGLSDEFEWANAAELGTNFRRADSDGDGVDDMIEWAAGTGIGDSTDSPRTRGHFVFVVPYEEPPDPEEDTLGFSTAIQIADVYFLMDRTGSMSEIGVMQTRLTEIIGRIACAPGEDPAVTGCIADVWTGVGWFTESDSAPDGDGLSSYTNVRNLTGDHAGVQASIPGATTSGSRECQRKATYCAAHGPGGACPADAQNLDAFPCPPGHVGYPCFRPDAARVLVLVTDENMDQDASPSYAVVGEALVASAITFVGINAEGNATAAIPVGDDLRELARAAGQPAGSELVYRGDEAGIVDSVVGAIHDVANVPFDVGARPLDDPTDHVDATRFIDYLEVSVAGTAECSFWSRTEDSSGDGHQDRFVQLPPGTPVCWDVHAAVNTFVEPTEVPQMFRATIEVRGGPGETLLDSRDVYFLVPPAFYVPPPG